MAKNKDVYLINHANEVVYSGSSEEPMKTEAPVKVDADAVDWVPWGADNLFPVEMMEKLSKSTILPSALDRQAKMIYGGGVVAGRLEDHGGKEVFVPDMWSDTGKEFRDFFRKTNVDSYAYGAALNVCWWGFAVPEIKIFDGKMVALFNIKSKKVRWGKQDSSGRIKKAFIHQDWQNGDIEKDKKSLPVLESGYNDAVRAGMMDADAFIYRVEIPSVLGDDFYPWPLWYTANQSKWLDYSIQIPEYKTFLMDNQMAIKYILYIDVSFWPHKFTNWENLDDAKKTKLKKAELDSFLINMKGTEKGGSALLAEKKAERDGKSFRFWEIEVVGDKAKMDETFMEDSAETSSHILNSVAMDPTLMGNGPGSKFGAGSGSDKRVAANIQIAQLKAIQDFILKPLELIRDFNGMDPDFVFRFRNTIQTTLDQGSSAKESS
jgi:hypothetical protein